MAPLYLSIVLLDWTNFRCKHLVGLNLQVDRRTSDNGNDLCAKCIDGFLHSQMISSGQTYAYDVNICLTHYFVTVSKWIQSC